MKPWKPLLYARENYGVRKALAVLELLLMVGAIWLDVLIPSVAVVGMGLLFLWIRADRWTMNIPPHFSRQIPALLGWAVLWKAANFTLLLPLQNHLLQTARDVSAIPVC